MTCDPVGAVEVAERLDVARATVDQWRTRAVGFPPPRWKVGGRPAWQWDDVLAWAHLTGRDRNHPEGSEGDVSAGARNPPPGNGSRRVTVMNAPTG